MVVELRPHHLLCLQKFEGEGYSDEFVENMAEVVERVEAGEDIRLVEGEDAICSACDEECDESSVEERDRRVIEVLPEGAEGRKLLEAARGLPESVKREVCEGCEWFDLCYGG